MNDSPNTTTTSARSLSGEAKLPLIAFVGKAGSGKTSGSIALSRLIPEYQQVHFAGTLKDAAQVIWGEDVHHNRGLLQWFGNTMREYDENVWVNAAADHIDRLHRTGLGAVVDDCRFPNEVEMLQLRGAYFIRTEAREEIRIDRLQRNGKFQTIEQLSDITETALDTFFPDYTIDTTGFDSFLDDLTGAVASVLDRIRMAV